MLIGGLFVYSATMVTESATMAPWFKQIWLRQIFWYLVGAGGAAALCMISYQTLARWGMVAYWFGNRAADCGVIRRHRRGAERAAGSISDSSACSLPNSPSWLTFSPRLIF